MIQGLENNSSNLELFAIGNEIKAFYKGDVVFFEQLPDKILSFLMKLMFRNKKALKALSTYNLSDFDKLKKYCWCNYGGINHEADINQTLSKSEYWDCGQRGICKHEGKICSEKILTKREIEFAKYLATGLVDKEIATKMNITYTTACDYRKNIQRKTNTTNKVELVNYLHRENLIN